jgi:tyrosyl-tRNA synthetase
MIGDPSGKSAERNLLSAEALRENVAGIERQIRALLDVPGGQPPVFANNLDWMEKFGYLEFLRDVGKNFPVNVMMSRDSVRARLESDAGISYTEFSYMLVQAYDFVYLNRHHGCELQVGGSDQWGNIITGIDLARRMDGVQLYGLTNPLLTTADGTKMGKTEKGAVWISAERTSPYQFYQYWINTPDEDVSKCLRFLTDLDREEIESLDQSRQEAPHENASQKRLAAEMTRLIHGDDELARAQRASQVLFGGAIERVTDRDLAEIFADVPSCEIIAGELEGEGIPLVDAFVRTGLAASKGETRRTIAQGGGYVNNHRMEDVDFRLTAASLASETTIVLRSGRKKYALLRIGPTER